VDNCIKKDNAVTYSKGIAIMLMVLGHACYSTYVPVWVNMFHVPAFYFLSGFCFDEKYLSDFKTFAVRKFQGIYWPFVKWTLIFILLHNLFFRIGVYNDVYGFNGVTSELYTVTDILKSSINVLFKLSDIERLLGGYWFLPCLFVGMFLFYLIVKVYSIWNNEIVFIMGGSIMLIISVVCNRYEISKAFLNYRVFEACVFILMGYLYKRTGIKLHRSKWFWIVSLIIVTLGSFFWQGSAANVSWQRQIPFMITAICGSISLYGICQKIDDLNIKRMSSFLHFVGNNTLTILTWHFSFFALVSFLIVNIYGLNFLRIGEFPVIVEYSNQGWMLVYFLFGIAGSLSLAYCNKCIKSKWLKL